MKAEDAGPMNSVSLTLDTCRMPGRTAQDFLPLMSSAGILKGHISPGVVESGTTTTLSSSSFCAELDTSTPGLVLPNSGGIVVPRLIQ